MSNERKSKNIVILLLCIAVVAMGIGFAAIGSRLNITGNTTITNTWNVQITKVEEELTQKKGKASGSIQKVDGTNARFTATLNEPGDQIAFKVTVTNGGTINAVLNNINNTTASASDDAIEYKVTGPTETSKLAASGATHEFVITVTYKETAV